MALIKKSNDKLDEYDVEIKATLIVRVKASNAFHAIAAAENELCYKLAKGPITVDKFKTVSSNSVNE